MKKISYLLFVVIFVFSLFLMIPSNIEAYEILDPIYISSSNPRFSTGGPCYKDTVKIRAFEMQYYKGGYIRLETDPLMKDCFTLTIMYVPEGISTREAMPHINNYPIYRKLNGNENFTFLPQGRYVYILESSLLYPVKKYISRIPDCVHIVFSAKLKGK